MRIAVVNNGKGPLKRLTKLLHGNDVEIFTYAKADTIIPDNFNLLILSGSSHLSAIYDQNKIKDELELIQRSTVPLLGICFGAELVTLAFGGTLKDNGPENKVSGGLEVEVLVDDSIFNGRKCFFAYDAHRWVIEQPGPELEVLARSAHGPEVIRHKSRPIYGFQFHPEKMPDETYGDELYASFVSMYTTSL